eukprot:9403975-Alexandrium_andersonii.AAC.1
MCTLAGLAEARQRNFGQPTTHWMRRWKTELSAYLAVCTGQAIGKAVAHRGCSSCPRWLRVACVQVE